MSVEDRGLVNFAPVALLRGLFTSLIGTCAILAQMGVTFLLDGTAFTAGVFPVFNDFL